VSLQIGRFVIAIERAPVSAQQSVHEILVPFLDQIQQKFGCIGLLILAFPNSDLDGDIDFRL
jgi:hypothetical protein